MESGVLKELPLRIGIQNNQGIVLNDDDFDVIAKFLYRILIENTIHDDAFEKDIGVNQFNT